ncbi:hypothetical protein ACIA8G_05710 [Lentzea sp. NPDC051213]|uniref:hypothetical protein n=1 Tax=Lentzea sp. NPDC051213 TaxID=3364126 RepID=UPI0037BE04F7
MNFFKKSLVATAAAAMCLTGASVASAAPAGDWPWPASAEAPCRHAAPPVDNGGALIILWVCDGGWHGQITNGQAGDTVWVESAAGTEYGHRVIPQGANQIDSAEVGQWGGPWRACGRHGGSTRCTGRA